MAENILELKQCPDCASQNVIISLDREQLTCRDCGLIFEPSPITTDNHKIERPKEKINKTSKTKKKTKKRAHK